MIAEGSQAMDAASGTAEKIAYITLTEIKSWICFNYF